MPHAAVLIVLVTMNDDIFTAATVTKRAAYRRNAGTSRRFLDTVDRLTP